MDGMANNFENNWSRPETRSVTEKIRDAAKPQGALKPRIQAAVNGLQVQISKMDGMLGKLRERDQRLFQRVVAAMQQQTTSTPARYSAANWPRYARLQRC